MGSRRARVGARLSLAWKVGHLVRWMPVLLPLIDALIDAFDDQLGLSRLERHLFVPWGARGPQRQMRGFGVSDQDAISGPVRRISSCDVAHMWPICGPYPQQDSIVGPKG